MRACFHPPFYGPPVAAKYSVHPSGMSKAFFIFPNHPTHDYDAQAVSSLFLISCTCHQLTSELYSTIGPGL